MKGIHRYSDPRRNKTKDGELKGEGDDYGDDSFEEELDEEVKEEDLLR